MPLRVAEKDGFIYALDDCEFCPFVEKNRNIFSSKPCLSCKHFTLDQTREVRLNSIPVWCPLPEPGGNKKTPTAEIAGITPGHYKPKEPK